MRFLVSINTCNTDKYDCDKVCCIVKRNGGEKGIYQKIEISPTITTDYAHQTNSYGLPHVIEFEKKL